MQDWFEGGANKVITDIYHDPKIVPYADAELRMNFIQNIFNWKIGPPEGLLYCSKEAFCDSMFNKKIDIYDHGLSATVVVTDI